MKLIAHRGWSSGTDENTLAAFRRAAAEPGVAGVELDVRRAAGGGLVVSHDPPRPGATVPAFDEAVRLIAGTMLEAFVELKEPGIGTEAARQLVSGGLSGRAVIFGFHEVLEPIAGEFRVGFGVIVRYPWQVRRLAATFAPDVILLGWDERGWTRLAFRAWWSIFSLRRMGHRHSADVVVGIVSRASDVRWLRKQGIAAAVVDMGGI